MLLYNQSANTHYVYVLCNVRKVMFSRYCLLYVNFSKINFYYGVCVLARVLFFQSTEVQNRKGNKGSTSSANQSITKRPRPRIAFSIRLRNIEPGVRVRDLKTALKDRGVKPRYFLKIAETPKNQNV